MNSIIGKAEELFKRNTKNSLLRARQLLYSVTPLSQLVETLLYDNEFRPQKLKDFPMMRQIYDHMPKRLLLKCSRKTLKSTLLSNLICLNSIRWNNFKMLYVGPLEATTKYFSSSYVNARFDSPPIKAICNGFTKNDVFEKIVGGTNCQILLRYANEDASRIRGPATDQNVHDECQDMASEILPIIAETMAVSDHKFEIYSGTPLTTDNTINLLWKDSNQMEWMMRCEHCNHWNSLTEDNDPMKMISKDGLCCSKCQKLLNSRNGEWVSFKPENKDSLVGYHLAQPILPYYNQQPHQWEDVYRGVFHKNYSEAQVYQEKFGIAFDTEDKPITEAQLRKLCTLGKMFVNGKMAILEKNKRNYVVFPGNTQYVAGIDFGVNGISSCTAVCLGALRHDSTFEVVYHKVFENNVDYRKQLEEISNVLNATNALFACDAGPDPARGIDLIRMVHNGHTKGQLVRYEAGHLTQRYHVPAGAVDWTQNRWVLHRSDTMTFTFRMLKEHKILFPDWEDSKRPLQDILNVYVEVKEISLRQQMFYRHKPTAPDDYMHALNWAVCQAHVAMNNASLVGPSSFVLDMTDDN